MTTTNKQKLPLNFCSIRRAHHLTLEDIATEAGFSSKTTVYLFEIGAIVDTETKETLIRALSRLTKQPYTVQDFTSDFEGHPTTTTQATGISLSGILEGRSV